MTENLQALWDQIRRLDQLKTELKRKEEQRDELSQRLKEAEKRLCHERAEVQRMEKPGLQNCFNRLFGQWEEQLQREKADVVRMEEARGHLAADLAETDARVAAFRQKVWEAESLQRKFDKAMERKRLRIIGHGGAEAKELASREEIIKEDERRLRGLQEAVSAGRRALAAAEQAIRYLDSADGLATWDLVGGGMLVDLAKHTKLDDAQQCMETLKSHLHLFEKELDDTAIHGDIQVNVEGLWRMADYWFDNLLTDWTVKSRIGESLRQVEQIRRTIEGVLGRIGSLQHDAERRRDHARDELRQWLIQTPLPE